MRLAWCDQLWLPTRDRNRTEAGRSPDRPAPARRVPRSCATGNIPPLRRANYGRWTVTTGTCTVGVVWSKAELERGGRRAPPFTVRALPLRGAGGTAGRNPALLRCGHQLVAARGSEVAHRRRRARGGLPSGSPLLEREHGSLLLALALALDFGVRPPFLQ